MRDLERRILPGGSPPERRLVAGVVLALTLSFVALPASEDSPVSEVPRLVVDVNDAPEPVLGALPRVGPALTGRILEARTLGPIRDVSELQRRVRGLGPATLELLLPHLHFDASRPATAADRVVAARAALTPVEPDPTR